MVYCSCVLALSPNLSVVISGGALGGRVGGVLGVIFEGTNGWSSEEPG